MVTVPAITRNVAGSSLCAPPMPSAASGAEKLVAVAAATMPRGSMDPMKIRSFLVKLVRTVATDGSRFFLGLPGRNDQTGYGMYFQYDLDPQAGTLKKTETKMDYHAYYQMRFDKSANRAGNHCIYSFVAMINPCRLLVPGRWMSWVFMI